MRIFLTFATITCFIVIASCTKDVGPNPDLAPKQTNICDTITFSKHIKPIIDNNCTGCHGAGYSYGDLTTHTGIKAKVDAGSFKARVVDQVPSVMPQGGTLTDAQLTLIKCWLDAGAPNN